MQGETRRITQLMDDGASEGQESTGSVQFIDEAPPPPEATGGLLKPFIAVVALLTVVIGGWAVMRNSSDLWRHDLAAGLEAAEETGRPVLVLFTADWCAPCRQLKREVLSDPEVLGYLATEYVPVKIDLTKRTGKNVDLARSLAVQGVPTMIVFDPDGLEIESNVGPLPKWELLDWLDRCKTQLPTMTHAE
jgi:thioredoxin-related protein